MRFHEHSARNSKYPIIVHSHLRWDWVWQRPQQFLSRLSKLHPILFVEGPHIVDENIEPRAVWRRDADFPNIVVMRTEFSKARWDAAQGAHIDVERYRLLRQELDGALKGEFDSPSNRPVQ